MAKEKKEVKEVKAEVKEIKKINKPIIELEEKEPDWTLTSTVEPGTGIHISQWRMEQQRKREKS